MNYHDLVNIPTDTGPAVRVYRDVDVEKLQQSLEPWTRQLSAGQRQISLRWAGDFAGTGDLRDTRSNPLGYREPDFCDWQPHTEYLQQVCTSLGVGPVGRVRLLLLPPNTCYSFHHDAGWRLHIPLQTNANAFMVIHGRLWHLPAGAAYLTNVEHHHTALNAGSTDRIHIVFGNSTYLLGN
jgi:Aspartyl/Asparaginyl beta-hydroxylase